jgi:hypothetical protein
MSKFLKILSLIFLPLAALVFVLALLGGATGKHGKNFFIKEYDEQNIYG